MESSSVVLFQIKEINVGNEIEDGVQQWNNDLGTIWKKNASMLSIATITSGYKQFLT